VRCKVVIAIEVAVDHSGCWFTQLEREVTGILSPCYVWLRTGNKSRQSSLSGGPTVIATFSV